MTEVESENGGDSEGENVSDALRLASGDPERVAEREALVDRRGEREREVDEDVVAEDDEEPDKVLVREGVNVVV